MVIGAGFAVLTVMTWGSFQGQAEYATPVTTTNSSSWDIHVDTARLSVGYSSTIDAPVAEFIVSYSWAGAFMAGKTSSDLYTVNFSESGTFILERTDWFPFAMFDNTSVIVTLRQGIEYTLNLSASVGSIRLDVPDGQVLGPLNVHTSTGSTSISLGLDTNVLGDVTIATSTGSTAFSIKDGSKVNGLLDVSSSTGSCSLVAGGANITGGIVASMSTGSLEAVLAGTILGGNVSWSSSTGSVDATMENVVLSRDIHLDVDVSTGSVLLNITQDVNPTANLTGRVVSSTGSVDISFSGASLFVNARFSASSSLGSTDFTNLGGFEKAGQLFLSTGTSAASTFSIDAVVSTGSVEITGLMV